MSSSLSLAFDILARDKASRALDSVGDAAEGSGRKLIDLEGTGKKVFAGLATGAAVAGVAVAKGFSDALDIGAGTDKLAAQLGLTEAESARFGDIAGSLFADAYGDSMSEVNTAISAVASTFEDLDDTGIRRVSAKALDLAKVFDLDINDAVNRSGILMRTGLAKNADHAADLVVKAMQSVPPAIRDELGEATTEYSKFFADLGITGEEMFGLFAEADDKFELDKTGDAIKELSIRATDMSATSIAAYEAAGLNAGEMAADIVAGGETAREAFEQIITGLYEIEDPVIRANAAIGLFGTPLEDLGVNEIPAFLVKLGEIETGIGNVGGAADAMGDTLNDNAATKIETFKREALTGLTNFIGTEVIPDIEELADAWGEDGFSGALDLIFDEKLPAWIDAWEVWVDEEGVPALGEIGKALGGALWDQFYEAAVKDRADDIETFLEGVLEPVTGEMSIRIPGTDIGFTLPGLPGRASGGFVTPGNWLVGERGPEVLSIGTTGYVTANHDLRASGFDALGEDQLLELRRNNTLLARIDAALRRPMSNAAARAAVVG